MSYYRSNNDDFPRFGQALFGIVLAALGFGGYYAWQGLKWCWAALITWWG